MSVVCVVSQGIVVSRLSGFADWQNGTVNSNRERDISEIFFVAV